MDTPTPPRPRGADNWAKPVTHLDVEASEDGGDAGSVTGRRLAGPVQGFGKMWQKTYRVALGAGVTPEHVVAEWRAHYGEFWPKGNRFYAPFAGVKPGEVALISGKAGGLKLSTGVLVLYADDVSFSFLTPEGHPFAGLITFSADRDRGVTTAQVQLLIRAQDPLVEMGMAFGGHRKEDRIWIHTLSALAAHLGVNDAEVDRKVVCVDKKRQWKRAGNVKHDAVFYALRKPFRRRRKPAA